MKSIMSIKGKWIFDAFHFEIPQRQSVIVFSHFSSKMSIWFSFSSQFWLLRLKSRLSSLHAWNTTTALQLISLPLFISSLIHPFTVMIFLKYRYCYVTLLLRKLLYAIGSCTKTKFSYMALNFSQNFCHSTSEALFPLTAHKLCLCLTGQLTSIPIHSASCQVPLKITFSEWFLSSPVPMHPLTHSVKSRWNPTPPALL